MKKLLGLLGAFGITATGAMTAATVVSCGVERLDLEYKGNPSQIAYVWKQNLTPIISIYDVGAKDNVTPPAGETSKADSNKSLFDRINQKDLIPYIISIMQSMFTSGSEKITKDVVTNIKFYTQQGEELKQSNDGSDTSLYKDTDIQSKTYSFSFETTLNDKSVTYKDLSFTLTEAHGVNSLTNENIRDFINPNQIENDAITINWNSLPSAVGLKSWPDKNTKTGEIIINGIKSDISDNIASRMNKELITSSYGGNKKISLTDRINTSLDGFAKPNSNSITWTLNFDKGKADNAGLKVNITNINFTK